MAAHDADADADAPAWAAVARRVQRERDDSLARVEPPLPALPEALPSCVMGLPRQLLSRAELDVTERSPENLVAALAAGDLTATAVTAAFLRRAALAQKLTNCVYELLPERALERAKELDEHLALHGTPVGPLHGLPVSIKEHVSIAGRDNTAGFVGWVGRAAADDALIVKLLLAAGAVVYARTTEPQGLMALETCSNLVGVTDNPHNRALTPGGSSGGESALLALRGSPLGLGSDIGGSIRSPAANCGLYGLKPSSGRLPLSGIAAYLVGCETVPPTIGPMSPTLGGIRLFMEAVLASQPWLSDPSLHQMPWRGAETHLRRDGRAELTVGVMWTDGVVSPSPPVARALREVVDKLRAAPGVRVVDWTPYRQDEAMDILRRLYSPDAGDAFVKNLELSGEPCLPMTGWAVRTAEGLENLTLQQVWNWTVRRNVFRQAYHDEWRTAAPDMDVILCPVHPLPAPVHNTSRYWGYTSLWNMLDYPAAAFPVTRVDAARDARDESYAPRNSLDAWCHEHYDAALQDGAPVALQLVARRLEDEKLVEALAEVVDKAGLPFVDCLA